MADHLPTFLLYYSGQWNDVTNTVSQGDGLKITQGSGEVSSALKPNQVQLSFEDPIGTYRVYRATSPLYGLAGRNTPLMAGFTLAYEDFEDASINITIGSGASVNPWARSTTSPHSGTWCFKSGVTANSQFSDAVITAPAGATACLLWYRTDSQSTDVIRISTGGKLRASAGGTGGAWTQIMVPVVPDGAGTREVYVRYLKDAGGTGGADAVYLDDVTFYNSRGVVEVSSWQPDQTLSYRQSPARGRAWTAVTAEGLLRRLATWTEPIISAYGRQLLQESTLTDLWPLDDASGSATFHNLVGPGVAFNRFGVTAGTADHPGGGEETCLAFNTSTQVDASFNRTGVSDYTFLMSFKVPESNGLSAFPTADPFVSWVTVQSVTYLFNVYDGGWQLQVFQGSATLLDISFLWGAGATEGTWVSMAISIGTNSSTTTKYNVQWTGEGITVPFVTSGTFSGLTGQPDEWLMLSPSDGNISGIKGAFVGKADRYDYSLSSTLLQAFAGYPGEQAGDRFVRLVTDAGFSPTLIDSGTATGSELMGPQRPGVLFDLLKEIRDTDGGMIIDSPGEVGLTMRTRRNLYSQTAALALTFGTNVAEPFLPILDDLNTHNLVTVSQRDQGGAATSTDSTGPMGTLPPPAGVGAAKQDITVNISSPVGQLQLLADWWRYMGTNPEARYSAVTVDFDANPEIEASGRAVKVGDRITVAGCDPDVIDLLVTGFTETQKTQKRNTLTYLCIPYRQYDVALYVASGATITSAMKRYDSRTSTLNAGYAAGVSPMVVTFTDPLDAWSTVTVPYDWAVAGERITVTAMGAVTGTGPYTQSATVTRAVNGVSKAQVAGAPVHMHPDQQARYAL